MVDVGAYRPCVGVMLINCAGLVFTGQRIDGASDRWQMPQGGIDEGEEHERAAMRELYEETGISESKVEIICVDEQWRRYDLPEELIGQLWNGRYCGQKQKWFLMGFLGDDSDVCLDLHEPEFSSWQWTNRESLPELIVPFKRLLYVEILEHFEPHINSYIKSCA